MRKETVKEKSIGKEIMRKDVKFIKRTIVFLLSAALLLGITACSPGSGDGTAEPESSLDGNGGTGSAVSAKTDSDGSATAETESGSTAYTEPASTPPSTVDPETVNSMTTGPEAPKAEAQPGESGNTGENETGNSSAENIPDIPEGDPVIGFVDSYENHILVLRDADDEDIILYFTTENALITSPGAPIAAGDMVEVTYTGVQGNAEHPGTATKVVKLPEWQ